MKHEETVSEHAVSQQKQQPSTKHIEWMTSAHTEEKCGERKNNGTCLSRCLLPIGMFTKPTSIVPEDKRDWQSDEAPQNENKAHSNSSGGQTEQRRMLSDSPPETTRPARNAAVPANGMRSRREARVTPQAPRLRPVGKHSAQPRQPPRVEVRRERTARTRRTECGRHTLSAEPRCD